jgi:hypothetical protein
MLLLPLAAVAVAATYDDETAATEDAALVRGVRQRYNDGDDDYRETQNYESVIEKTK